MEAEHIIETIKKVFEGADERDWKKVQDTFADTVLLDYSSMNGSPAAILSSADIIKAWRGFLPGFDKTHHQVFDFRVDQADNKITAHFSGRAVHFIDEDSWTVEGNYDVEIDESGKVSKFKFNLQKQSGNTDLPQKAVENAAKK